MKGICLFIFVCVFVSDSIGQEISNVQAKIENDEIAVYFDLRAQDGNSREFFIHLYSSHNDYQSPLTNVSGDVGEKVLPGIGKKIIWDYTSELKNFNDTIDFKLLSKITFIFPENGTVMKRGKDYEIEWYGGEKDESLKLDLINNSVSMQETSVKNSGYFRMSIPPNLKPGKNYQLKLTDTDSPDRISFSKTFIIRNKVPGVLKGVLPGIVGLAVWILMNQTGSENDSPTSPGGLPPPPMPEDIIN